LPFNHTGTGRCAELYEKILKYQGVCPIDFTHCLFETVTVGREKGNAMMVVGGKDSGKTTVTQPASKVFKCMPTPQSDSFCPLQNLRGHEVCLWQDLRYAPGHPSKDEQGLRIYEGTWNRLLEGLPTLVGVAKTDGRADFVFDEDVAFLFTGPFELTAWRNGRPDARETEQLATRVRYVHFQRPAPPRVGKSPKPCPLCWSRWVLRGQVQWVRQQSGHLDDFLSKAAAAVEAQQPAQAPEQHRGEPHHQAPPIALPLAKRFRGDAPLPRSAAPVNSPEQMFQRLAALCEWRAAGLLSESEFVGAKQALGLR
jgi:hypothetical protein